MNNPKFSIITAVYNNKDTISDSINSVLSQDYTNIEYIVIDGNSNDGTQEVIRPYLHKIDKYISEEDHGIYDALNKGIKHATGEIIAFLHSDDVFFDKRVLTNVAEVFTTEEVDSTYGDLVYVSKNDIEKVIRFWKSGTFTKEKLSFGWMPPHPTLFVKKTVYNSYGTFNTDLKISADYDLILRFFSNSNVNCKYIPRTLVKMRIGGESNKSLSNIVIKTKEDLFVVKKNNIGNFTTVFFKNFRKLCQFIKKDNY